MHRTKAFVLRFDRLWGVLRSPETWAFLLILLAAVMLLSVLIPQAPANFEAPEAQGRWLAGLSPGRRALAERGIPFGLHRLFSTAWFWLPAAALSLSSLVAAADGVAAIGQRLWPDAGGGDVADLFLSRRVQRVGRIHRKSEAYLAQLRAKLAAAGYRCLPPEPENPRSLVAVRHRWSWLSPLLVYLGLALMLIGLAAGARWGASETTVLRPQGAEVRAPFNRVVTLRQVDFKVDPLGQVVGGTAHVAFSAGGDRSNESWPLHRPLLRAGWLIWVVDVVPVIKVSMTDLRGNPQFLFPDQPETRPGTSLRLGLEADTRSALFFGPQRQWAMQVTHHGYLAAPGQQFSLRLVHLGQGQAAPPVWADADGAFEVEQLSGQVALEHNVRVFASRAWHYLLVALGGMALLSGVLALILAPPSLITISLNVKGFGGQATAQGETFGSVASLADTLADLLADTGEEPGQNA
ncbi:MAG: cytochrome c biogenesis protein ResB [Anaerolineae bacterium]